MASRCGDIELLMVNSGFSHNFRAGCQDSAQKLYWNPIFETPQKCYFWASKGLPWKIDPKLSDRARPHEWSGMTQIGVL